MAHNPRTSKYKVKKGDTLWSIANEQYGDSSVWPEIKNANRLAKGNLSLVGQTLHLPYVLPRGPLSAGGKYLAVGDNRPRSEATLVAQQFANPTFKINLTEHVKPIPVLSPLLPSGWRGEIKLEGEISFVEKGGSSLEISGGGLELTSYRMGVSNK